MATPLPESETPSPDLEDPRLLPFLPLLYVAWADGSLDEEEMGSIRARCQAGLAASGALEASLDRWLNPAAPPSPTLLQGLLASLRRGAERLPAPRRLSLAELGVELAFRAGHAAGEAERAALRALEEAIGAGGSGTASWLLGRPGPGASQEADAAPPGPDPRALLRLLDGSHHGLRERVRALLAEPYFQLPPEIDRPAQRAWTLERCRELARRGYGALSYPESCGGAGDYGAFLATFETLACGDLSLLVKLGVQFGLFGGSLLQLGTERHHERYLRDVGSLALPGCFAMTETGHGSNVAEVETTATYDPERGDFVLQTPSRAARKDYIGNAGEHGRMATVFAQLQVGGESHGVHALVVPIRDEAGAALPGVHLEDCGAKMGLNGVDNGRIGFDGVRVPRENLLDRFGQVGADGVYASSIASPSRRFFTMLGTLIGGRLSVAFGALSASKTALAIALRYTAKRRQFGPEGGAEVPVLDYPSVQRRLLPRLAATYAHHFALREAEREFLSLAADPGGDRRDLEGAIAGLKASATWHATDTIQTCREACGGRGYLAESRFDRLKADTDVFTTFEGDNTVLLQLLGKSLLTGYRKQFGDMRLLGLVRYVVAHAEEAITERNPVATRRTDEDHLRSREFFLQALGWRERSLIGSVARRIRKRLQEVDGAGARKDPFVAVTEVQEHLIEAARAHVERRVAESFARAIDGAEEALRPSLEHLLRLYALSRIEADRGWYQEHGYLESGKSKAVRKCVERLCREVRPQALALVEGFGVPEAWAPRL